MTRRDLLLLWWPALQTARDAYQQQREQMVTGQIAARDVRDPRVLGAMREIPRHLFVPESLRGQAYEDHPLPIGHGQTISQPYIVAVMTELLKVDKKSRVLEIGTGSGYQAAVLSRLAGHVYTIEIVPELANNSTALLRSLGFANVTVRHGDGYKGWPEQAPFDAIMLTAAPPEVPQALLDQLKPGGRLIAPVGRTVFSQDLVMVEKTGDGKLKRRSIFPVRFVPMVPAAK